jgi:hypothetical protein
MRWEQRRTDLVLFFFFFFSISNLLRPHALSLSANQKSSTSRARAKALVGPERPKVETRGTKRQHRIRAFSSLSLPSPHLFIPLLAPLAPRADP